jgi:Na+-driven multidrug efflux pump
VLDLFFVAVLGMGASGAAVATALCHLLSALLALFFLKRTLNGLSLTSSLRTPVTADLAGSVDGAVPADITDSADMAVLAGGENITEKTGRTESGGKSQKLRIPSRPRIPKDIARRILRMGLPLGFSEVTFTFANLILMSVVNRLGTDTVAAYAAYGKIDAIFWMVVGSFGISITTFVGQNIGAGRWDRVMQSIRECALMMFLVMGVVIGTLYYFSYPLQHLFCTDLAVVEIGTRMMHFLMPFYFLYIPIEILFGALRGMGDSLLPTLITFFGVCVLRSAWGIFTVPLHHTVNMVLLGFPVTWIVSDLAFAVYFYWYVQRNKPDKS